MTAAAAFLAIARALAAGSLWLVIAVLAMATVASLVQAALTSFETWRTGRRYRRRFNLGVDEALGAANASADAFDREVRAGVPIIPPPGPLPVERPFVRPLDASPAPDAPPSASAHDAFARTVFVLPLGAPPIDS